MSKVCTDQHCHTILSPDNVGPHIDITEDHEPTIQNYMHEAPNKGITEITFTEHVDLYDGVNTKLKTININEYYNEYQEREESLLTTNFGIELGLRPECEDKIRDIVSSNKFDLIIGSQHITKGMDIAYDENFYEKLPTSKWFYGYRKSRAIRKTILKYFEEVLTNIEMYPDCFDVLGHLDYVSRYIIKYYNLPKTFVISPTGYDDYKKLKSVIKKIFKLLIKYEKALEINTSGLRYGLGTVHPNPELLQIYYNLGGRLITFGSDAHRLEHVGYGFKKATEIALNCGFDEYAVYKDRNPVMHKIR